MSQSPAFRLRNPNPQIREQTLMELVFDPSLDYLDVLNTMVSDKDRDVRRTLMLALGALNDEGALESLLLGLLDEDNDVVIAAEHALSKLGKSGRDALWQWTKDADWLKRKSALQALKHFDVNVEQISGLTRDEIWEVRYTSYLLLGALDVDTDASLALLLNCLRTEEHAQAREGIIYALGSLQTAPACEALLNIFFNARDTEDLDVLAQALEGYGEAIQEPLLRWGLWGASPHGRALSAALLSQTHYSELEQTLEPLLLDPDRQVRETVSYALYQKTENPFWELLAGLYQESETADMGIFQAALDAILQLAEPVLQEKTRHLLAVYDYTEHRAQREAIVRGLKAMEAYGAAQVFIEKLEQSSDVEEAALLIETLGSWEIRDAYRVILERFDCEALRNDVARALCAIAPEEKVWQKFLNRAQLSDGAERELYQHLATFKTALVFLESEALHGESATQRKHALMALLDYQKYHGYDLADFLTHYLKAYAEAEEETLDVLIQLSESIPALPEACFKVLYHWLTLPAENLRRGAMYIIKPHMTHHADDLMALLSHELWFVRQSALELLAPLQTQPVIKAIQAALTDRDQDVRIMAVSLVGQMQTPERLDWLVNVLENGYREIRAVAARALAHFVSHSTVTEPLELALVEDEAGEVRQAAIETLAQLQVENLEELIEDALGFEDDPQVWWSAIRALADVNVEAAHHWAIKFLAEYAYPETVHMLLPLFDKYHWPPEPLRTALENPAEPLNPEQVQQAQQLGLDLLPLLCRVNPELARESLFHEQAAVVAAVILHLPAAILEAEQIWLKSLWRQGNPEVRRAIYMRWSKIDALWAAFSELARDEEDLSLRQIIIEQLGGVDLHKALTLCESLFLKHTEQTQSPLIWSLASHLQQETLTREVLHGLFRVMSRSQDHVREQVFAMLLRVGGTHAFDLLKMCLESWDQELSLSAIQILPHWGERALQPLMDMWSEAQLATQVEILKALLLFEPSVLQARVAELNEHLKPALRVNALRPFVLEVCARWGTKISRPFLVDYLQQLQEVSQRTLRYDLYAGLITLSPEEPLWRILQAANSQLMSTRERALVRLKQWMTEQLQAVAVYDDLELQSLLSYLGDDEAYTVRLRYYALNCRGDSSWRNRLIRALRYDVLPIQQLCVYRLSDYFDRQVQEELLGLWASSRYGLKETLLTVLAYNGMPGFSLDALANESDLVRLSASCIAGQHGLQTAEPLLIQHLHGDAQDQVREACCWALGWMKTETAFQALCQVVEESHFALQYQAIRALRYYPEAVLFLLQRLSALQKDRELLVMTLDSLQALAPHFPDDAPAEPLIEVIEMTYDTELRQGCLALLQQLKAPAAARYLKQLSMF